MFATATPRQQIRKIPARLRSTIGEGRPKPGSLMAAIPGTGSWNSLLEFVGLGRRSRGSWRDLVRGACARMERSPRARAQPTRTMRRTLRVLPEAETELQSAAICYEGKRPGLATRSTISKALAQALSTRGASPPRRRNRRSRCSGARQATSRWLVGSLALGC
jgi:hypothetical protein